MKFEWTREPCMAAIDYPEVEVALSNFTGADKVVIFDPTLRDSHMGRCALRSAGSVFCSRRIL